MPIEKPSTPLTEALTEAYAAKREAEAVSNAAFDTFNATVKLVESLEKLVAGE